MGKLRRTTEQFIEEVRAKIGDKYDLSLVEYTGITNRVKVICPKHGLFEKPARMLLKPSMCPECLKEDLRNRYRKTKEQFIEEAIKKHGDLYSYDKVEYVNSRTNVKIYCKKHKEYFNQTPSEHLFSKTPCLKCSYEKRGIKMKMTQEVFLERCKEVGGDAYLYHKAVYEGNKTKVELICRKHGAFFISPNNFLNNKQGCRKCGHERAMMKNRDTLEDFIRKSNATHNNRYIYDYVDYVNSSTKVSIVCKEHGVFTQLPECHIAGSGCPYCHSSKGEIAIQRFLDFKNISYKREYRLPSAGRFEFDFFLDSYNVIIEFHGGQHVKPVEYFGGISALLSTRKRDVVKKQYCINNNINFLEIYYWDYDNIDSIVSNFLESL